MEIIGEAVKRLPPQLRDRYPGVESKLIAGTRDHLSHGYDDIRHDVLWNAVQLDVPTLITTVEQMLKDLENPDNPQSE